MRACVFSLDDSYVMPFKVFYSTLEATFSLPNSVDIYIIHSCSLSRKSILEVSAFVASYKRNITFRDASTLLPKDLPIRETDHVSIATYYRLFLASILPSQVHEAVYLDVDMLAVKSVSMLFQIPLKLPLAAADHLSLANQLRLHGDTSGTYFQAGVIVADLKQWRKARIEQLFLKVLDLHSDKILWHDQDILNLALGSSWQRLSVWLNVCDTHFRFLPASDVRNNACLIHFNGPHKPWNSLCRHPFVDSWDRAYLKLFGQDFNRALFLPPARKRFARAILSRLSGLRYGRYLD